MTTAAEFLITAERIAQGNKKVLAEIDQALSLEEQHQQSVTAEERQNTAKAAIQAYEQCLLSIEGVFSIPVGMPDNMEGVQDEWQNAITVIRQLKRAQTELQHRLKVLRAGMAAVDGDTAREAKEEEEQPKAQSSNDEAAGGDQAARSSSIPIESPVIYGDPTEEYKAIIKGLRELIATEEKSDVIFDTLFQSSAKLYKIEGESAVTTIAGEANMSLVMCTVSGKWIHLNGVCFIQCSPPEPVISPSDTSDSLAQFGGGGDSSSSSPPRMIWLYALVPKLTTCYCTSYGAFILPDLESAKAGTAFGIMLTDSSALTDEEDARNAGIQTGDAIKTLTDLEQFYLDLLEAVLSGQVEHVAPAAAAPEPLIADGSHEVSRNIVRAADFVAHNLVRGAEKTGEFLVWGTPYVIRRLRPAAADARPVSSTVQTSVEVAKTVTSAAAGVTGWVAGKVGIASSAIGRALAPHIQSHGAALLQKSFGYNTAEANTKMEGAMTIAAGAVEGFATVFDGLESSAKILGQSLSDNSTKIIEHKYGQSAANVAAGTFDTIGNAFNVSRNVNYITPKGLAKKMMTNTGKAVVDDYKSSLREAEAEAPAAGQTMPAIVALCPDLRSAAKAPADTDMSI